jgi:hypothetical protein
MFGNVRNFSPDNAVFSHEVLVELRKIVAHLGCDLLSYLERSNIVLAHAHAVYDGDVHGFFVLLICFRAIE